MFFEKRDDHNIIVADNRIFYWPQLLVSQITSYLEAYQTHCLETFLEFLLELKVRISQPR